MNSRKLITNTVLWRTLVVVLIPVLMIAVVACADPAEKIEDANEAARTGGSVSGSEKSTTISSFDLRVGDCYNDKNLNELALDEKVDSFSVELVPCSTAHDFEVLELILIDKPSGAPYPGESYFEDIFYEDCPLEAEFFMFPVVESWAMDDRVLTCIAN